MSAGMREVKLVLLGDTAVGKSSLAQRFVTDTFNPMSDSTIGCDGWRGARSGGRARARRAVAGAERAR